MNVHFASAFSVCVLPASSVSKNNLSIFLSLLVALARLSTT
jgi:hypothetical protein